MNVKMSNAESMTRGGVSTAPNVASLMPPTLSVKPTASLASVKMKMNVLTDIPLESVYNGDELFVRRD